MQYIVFQMMDKKQVQHLDDPMSEAKVATKTLIRGPLTVKLTSSDQASAGTLFIDIEVSWCDVSIR